MRIFNKANRTFKLVANDGSVKLVKPLSFGEIEDKFHGDLTFQMGIETGELQPYESASQADKIEVTAHEEYAEAVQAAAKARDEQADDVPADTLTPKRTRTKKGE